MAFTTEIPRRRLVLVVEDQEINQGVLEFILEGDYDIVFADNGAEALEEIQKHLHDLSIILLDLIMPVMDGFEVLERVRDDAQMSRIPIIVMTSEKDAELRALQLGAADFITKPFDAHEVILARVKRIIELNEGRNLIRATEYDPVSQLYTQGFFVEYAERLLRYQPDVPMDALVLNIDRFHSINDLNGRDYGNNVLRLVGSEIKEFLSEASGIASRIEADRFHVICAHQEDYEELLVRFQAKVNAQFDRVSIRLRMGVSPWESDMTMDQLFDRANTACNMVRGSYKCHLMVYDEEVHERELFYQRLLNDLRPAVEERQFLVYFQPKYDIQQSPPRLASAEALIRWNHPDLGMISPGDFIPLFERSGLIHVVDAYVWEESARQIARWRDDLGVKLPVSVNLSRMEIFDPLLESVFIRLVEENDLQPSDLKLEVTESAYTDDADQLIEAINRLRKRGFEVEMDDFGSGYSSLNMISTLPIDALKMDMKFIQNVESDDKAFRLVELVLDIAKYLDVPVVAEGVETDNQLLLLQDAGCDLVQGFYFSRPLPIDEFTELLEKETNRGGDAQ